MECPELSDAEKMVLCPDRRCPRYDADQATCDRLAKADSPTTRPEGEPPRPASVEGDLGERLDLLAERIDGLAGDL